MQAFSYGGSAYALQFHMDVTHATMCRWTTRGHERMALPNAKPRESHFEGRLMHDPACKAWLYEFIDHWLKPPAPAKAGGAKPRQRKSRRRSPPSPMAAAVSAGRVEGFDPVERREHLPPDQHHQQRADAADHHRRNGAEPCRHQAGAEIAELVRRDHEQRVHGAHPAAHVVGGLELDQRHADDDADHVGGAQHG